MLLMNRILAPVDFSAPSAGATRYARSLAMHLGCELTLVHVLELTAFEYSPIQATPERLDELMEERTRTAQGELERFPERESGSPKTHRLILKGDTAEQILVCAQSAKADLIVMPTHGYDPIRRFLLGSVASKVLHGANVPVITGAHFEENTNLSVQPRHIVCGLDLGPCSARVLKWATQLAHAFAAQLTVVHATPDLGESAGDSIHPDWLVQMNSRVQEQVAHLQHAATDKAQVLVATGDPHKALSNAVQRLNADLLVIGRGASAAGPFGRLRAHAYAIIRSSPCPVVSV